MTKVRFYLEPGAGEDVLAVFDPDDPGQRGIFECYSHVGQHSTCSAGYLSELKEASPEQYARLKKELESIGYFLEVV